MGNIYARHMKDYDTAMTYFDQVVEVDPNNYRVLSNIGGMFLKADKLTLAPGSLRKPIKEIQISPMPCTA